MLLMLFWILKNQCCEISSTSYSRFNILSPFFQLLSSSLSHSLTHARCFIFVGLCLPVDTCLYSRFFFFSFLGTFFSFSAFSLIIVVMIITIIVVCFLFQCIHFFRQEQLRKNKQNECCERFNFFPLSLSLSPSFSLTLFFVALF